MKKLSLLALSLVAVGTAFADDITIDSTPFVSTKTRAEVQAEMLQARADGSMAVWSDAYNPLALARSERTRAEVRAEIDPAFGAVMYGEDSGSFHLARVAVPETSTDRLVAQSAE